METLSKFTKSGVVESLSLVRWMQPYCDDKKFTLNKNNIIFIVLVLLTLLASEWNSPISRKLRLCLFFNLFQFSEKILMGRDFIKKNILQLAIALLGIKISFSQLASVSIQSIGIIIIAISIIFG